MAYTEPDKLKDVREDKEERPAFNPKELLQEAVEAYEEDFSEQGDDIEQSKADVEFADLDQWGDDRRDPSIPSLTINQLPQFWNKVANSFRASAQEAKIVPVDQFADVETAKALQGYWRHVEQRSRAKAVYNHALMQALKGGMGWMRVYYDYINEESFEMDLLIERVVNRFTVLPGRAIKADFSDMSRFHVEEPITQGEFEHLYPKAKDTLQLGKDDTYKNWFIGEDIVIRNYWRKVENPDELWLMSNGMKIFKSVETEEKLRKRGLYVIRRRKVMRPEWQWFKVAAGDILKSRIWLGRFPSYVPIVGNEKVLPDGRIIYTGIPREARDPQTMYNYWASVEAQLLQRNSKRRVVNAEGQIEGYEHLWASEDSDNLTYRPTTHEGHLVPPPRYEEPPQIPTGVVNAKQVARADIMAALGVYQDSLGAPSNAQSGIAIRRRQSEGNESQFHYPDNADSSIEQLCRVGIDLMRKVITKTSLRRVLGPDDEEKFVEFNKISPDGTKVLFDLSVGEFDVRCASGPSFINQQQETLDMVDALGKGIPQVAAVGPDILVALAAGGRPELKELAARLKLTVDPKFLATVDQKDAEKMVAVLQSEVMGAKNREGVIMQAVEKLTDELMKARASLENKAAEIEAAKYKADLDYKGKIEVAQINKGLVGAAEVEASLDAINQELAQVDLSLEQRGIGAPKPPALPTPSPMANPGEEPGAEGMEAGEIEEPPMPPQPGENETPPSPIPGEVIDEGEPPQ